MEKITKKLRGAVFIGAGLAILIIIGLFFYFLPTTITCSKHKKNSVAICALNVLPGWTFIGWVAALVWSLTND